MIHIRIFFIFKEYYIFGYVLHTQKSISNRARSFKCNRHRSFKCKRLRKSPALLRFPQKNLRGCKCRQCQMAGSATPSTPDSQPFETLPAPFSTDLNSADALEELLQQVGLSSDNLLETPAAYENRPLPARPPPEPLEELHPSEPKRNKRGRKNAPRHPDGTFQSLSSLSTEKTSTVPTTSEQDTSLKMKIRVPSYANLPPVFSSDTTYENLPTVIASSSSTTSYSVNASNNSSSYTYSDTLTPSTLIQSNSSFFEFPSSENLASDLVAFLVQISPQPQSASKLHLLGLENMLRKHFYPSLVSHINSLYRTYPNRNYITFEFIIRNCLSYLGIN